MMMAVSMAALAAVVTVIAMDYLTEKQWAVHQATELAEVEAETEAQHSATLMATAMGMTFAKAMASVMLMAVSMAASAAAVTVIAMDYLTETHLALHQATESAGVEAEAHHSVTQMAIA